MYARWQKLVENQYQKFERVNGQMNLVVRSILICGDQHARLPSAAVYIISASLTIGANGQRFTC